MIEQYKRIVERGRELHKYLTEKYGNSAVKRIREKCRDCAVEDGKGYAEITYCQVVECPLWEFRFGKSPNAVKDKKLLDPEWIFKHNNPNQ